ncbi:MAG: hypothetical protein HC810_03150 [Acaryochloridaceae cyanobacterium RL_2_7]|nr:hypothetical protein [Acaryochloridaceae cyanobacterium RL_2_7]
MTSPKSNRKVKKNLLLQPIALAALMTGGILQPFMMPAFAATAGTTISNTATAEYEDDDGNSFETESNTVTVSIAEVAGITVKTAGVVDQDGPSVETGDLLDFKFNVTNKGNDHTDIFIPNLSNITKQNLDTDVADGGQLEISFDGGATFAVLEGTTPAIPGNVASTTGGFLVASVAPDAVIQIKVTGAVAADDGGILDPGEKIIVTLGDTGSNDNDNDLTQNQADKPDSSNTNEVRTVDRDDADTDGCRRARWCTGQW